MVDSQQKKTTQLSIAQWGPLSLACETPASNGNVVLKYQRSRTDCCLMKKVCLDQIAAQFNHKTPKTRVDRVTQLQK